MKLHRKAAKADKRMPPPEKANVEEDTRSNLQNRDNPIRILVIGRSDSGKTYIVQDACGNTSQPMTNGFYKATQGIEVTATHLNGQSIELIDTPGFDNIGMSDADVFVKIATYLLDSQRINEGITGIIYVHRAGDTLHSRSFLQNFRVMANIFFGDTGISRLTTLVTHTSAQILDYGVLSNEIRSPDSAFSQVFSMGAKLAPNSSRSGFLETLQSYASQTPIKLLAQLDGSHDSIPGFRKRVEQSLALCDYQLEALDTLERRMQELAESLAKVEVAGQGFRRQLQQVYSEYASIRSQFRLTENVERSEAIYELTEKLSALGQADSIELRQQLQQAQLEYASLRSQLCLQENIEQSEVVQTLNDLNRIIDDVGRSISAYLVDTYVQSTFGKEPYDVTTLDSRDLIELKRLIGHLDGRPSLVASEDGRALDIESFLDFSTRRFLCGYLFDKIFRPFHPQMEEPQSKVLLANYESIQKRELQAVAGRWRAEAFKNIHKTDGTSMSHIASQHVRRLIDSWFTPLTQRVFGMNISLQESHHMSLQRLVQTAWEWNTQLKESVIMLGDFIQIYFPPSQFNPQLMDEFEPGRHDPGLRNTLGTVALGLECRRALGKSSPVEKIAICKPLVITERIFD